jgi:uncharacterized protein YdaU (DUF1376 family)
MAAGRPWYKRSGGDFVMGTLHMPMEARLAYSLIIDMLNDRDRPLPDDADFICGFTKLSKRKWRDVREFLLNDADANGESRIYLNDRGELTNPRFEREREDRDRDGKAAAEAGSKGGKKAAELRAQRSAQGTLPIDEIEKKSGKSRDKREINGRFREDKLEINGHAHSENNNLAVAPPVAIRAREEAREEKREEEDSTTPTADPEPPARTRAPAREAEAVDEEGKPDLMDTLAKVAGVAGVHVNPAFPSPYTRELDILRGWLKAGYDLDRTIIPTIENRAAHTREQEIRSLSFFSAAIAKVHAGHANGTGPPKDWTPEERIAYTQRMADLDRKLGR